GCTELADQLPRYPAVKSNESPSSPALASAPTSAWGRWLRWLLERGRATLASLGLVLVAGFAAGVAALLVFAELAEAVLDKQSLAIDQAVLVSLRALANPLLDGLAFDLSLLGSEVLAVLLALTLSWLVWKRRYG